LELGLKSCMPRIDQREPWRFPWAVLAVGARVLLIVYFIRHSVLETG